VEISIYLNHAFQITKYWTVLQQLYLQFFVEAGVKVLLL